MSPHRLLVEVKRHRSAVVAHSFGLRSDLDADLAAAGQRVQHEPIQPELGRPPLSRRFDIDRSLLARPLAAADRMLIYALPLSRIIRLTATDIIRTVRTSQTNILFARLSIVSRESCHVRSTSSTATDEYQESRSSPLPGGVRSTGLHHAQ